MCDWFDARTGGHQDLDETCSGAICRIARKISNLRFLISNSTPWEGQIAALKSPAINVRHVGFTKLKALGKEAVEPVAKC